MLKSKLLGLVLLFSTLVAEEVLVKRTQVIMGTYVSISVPKSDIELSNLAFKRLHIVEKALSSYDKRAEIYILNHKREVSLSVDSYEALSLCQKYYKYSDGYFDITIGSITKGLFHFGEEEHLPKKIELEKAKVDFKGLHFTQDRAWTDEGIVIDLGGMGKGFGVDKAVEALSGVSKAVIALSGDIYCIGSCKMEIQNPFEEEGVLASFIMTNMAISTSGNYRRFVKSSKYNHLINPKKKASQKNFASITLVSDNHSNSDLDAYATAASVMPYDTTIRFLKQMKVGYLLVKNTKELVMNERFKILTSELTLVEPLKKLQREYIKAVPLTFQSSKKLSL